MFPSVRVKVRNLDPCQQYYVAMDVMPVDSKRYRCVCVCVCNTWINVIIHLLVYLRLRARSLQVRVPQLPVDGGGEHGPLVHLPAPLRAPGLSVRGGDVDASGHQLWPGQAHQQRDGR